MKTQKIKWLKPHPQWAYFPGDICSLDSDQVDKLCNLFDEDLKPLDPFVEILPDDFIEEVPNKVVIPDDQYIEVTWLKVHMAFAYNEGDKGKVTPENYKKLFEEGYVLPLKKNSGFLNRMFKK